MNDFENLNLSILNKENVFIKSPHFVYESIKKMQNDALNELHIVTDFDWTLTKYEEIDGRNHSSYDILIFSENVNDVVKDEYNKCEEYYMPYYLNPQMSMRKEKLIEYWGRINEISIKANLNIDDMKEIVRKTNVTFRDNSDSFFRKLDSYQIPVSIISAGIGNVIIELMNQKSKIYSNMNIIANFIEFCCQNGQPKKFIGETIHMFNKKEAISFDKNHFNLIKNRSNIILLGDSEGDELIANGLPNVKNILKIGFLNKIDETKLEKYKNIFDIVLINDLTFNVPNEILNFILNK